MDHTVSQMVLKHYLCFLVCSRNSAKEHGMLLSRTDDHKDSVEVSESVNLWIWS